MVVTVSNATITSHSFNTPPSHSVIMPSYLAAQPILLPTSTITSKNFGGGFLCQPYITTPTQKFKWAVTSSKSESDYTNNNVTPVSHFYYFTMAIPYSHTIFKALFRLMFFFHFESISHLKSYYVTDVLLKSETVLLYFSFHYAGDSL